MASGGSLSPYQILVVEDNKVQQRLMSILLAKIGAEATIVSSGPEALEALEQDHYDLVLMDWKMPEMDGLECARQIRERDSKQGKHTPIVAVTASDTDSRSECLRVGMDDFLSKPFSVEEFAEIVKRWLPVT